MGSCGLAVPRAAVQNGSKLLRTSVASNRVLLLCRTCRSGAELDHTCIGQFEVCDGCRSWYPNILPSANSSRSIQREGEGGALASDVWTWSMSLEASSMLVSGSRLYVDGCKRNSCKVCVHDAFIFNLPHAATSPCAAHWLWPESVPSSGITCSNSVWASGTL